MTSTTAGASTPGPNAEPEFVPLSRRRFPALEGLRGLAAIGVLFQHLGFWTGATFNTRAGGLLARLDWGVPVFFAISGFLLFRAPAEALLDRADVRPFPNLKRFWHRRIWRVFPAYLFVFAVVMIVPRHITDKPSILELPLHALLLQIYPTDTFAEGISQAWSLSVEISFYLLLPFFGRALLPIVRGKDVNARAMRLLGVMVGLVAFSTLWRTLVFAVTDGDAFRAVFWLPGTIDYFAIGMAMAVVLAWADQRAVGQELSDAIKTLQGGWWMLAVIPYAIMAYGLDLDVGLGRSSWHLELLRQACTFVIGAMLIAPAIFVDETRAKLSMPYRFLTWRPVEWFGAISFSFYLWHLAVLETMFRVFNHKPDLPLKGQFLDWDPVAPWGQAAVITISTVVISILLAIPTYRYVELPTMAYSRKRNAQL